MPNQLASFNYDLFVDGCFVCLVLFCASADLRPSFHSLSSFMAARFPLYKHALESVLAFFSLRELSSLLAVSRVWLAAVESMHSIDAKILGPFDPPPNAVCASRLARHLSTWLSDKSFNDDSLAAPLLLHTLRSLHTLRCKFAPLQLLQADGSVAAVSLPANLTRLDLTMADSSDVASVNAIVQSISRLPLLQSLVLRLPRDPLVSFVPLQSLPLLSDLGLHWPNMHQAGQEPTEAHIEQIRALPALTQLTPTGFSSATLLQLLRTPHSLRLQSMDGLLSNMSVDAELSALLPGLPSLTRLGSGTRPVVLQPDCDFSFLPRLPALTELHLNLRELDPESLDLFASSSPSLQQCTQIKALWIFDSDLTCEQLTVMLAHLTNLQSLYLTWAAKLTSLSFLTSGSLRHTLLDLSLDECDNDEFHSHELMYVESLQSLRYLNIDGSFDEQSRNHIDHSLYTPPSEIIPTLRQFEARR